MRTKTVSAPGSQFERVQHRFDLWRKTRKRCSPIPETLWSSAVELAREHGLHRTARTLRLNYYSLKKHFRLITDAPGRPQGRRKRRFYRTLSAGRRGSFRLHYRDGKCAGREDEDPASGPRRPLI